MISIRLICVKFYCNVEFDLDKKCCMWIVDSCHSGFHLHIMEDIILRLAVIEKTDTEEVERAVRTTALKFLPKVIIL